MPVTHFRGQSFFLCLFCPFSLHLAVYPHALSEPLQNNQHELSSISLTLKGTFIMKITANLYISQHVI